MMRIASILCSFLFIRSSLAVNPPNATSPPTQAATTPSITNGGVSPSDPLNGALSLEDAIRIGLQRNPQIAAGFHGAEAARATYRSDKAFPAPNLGLTHVTGTSAAPTLNGTTNDTFLDVGETFDTSGQRRYQAGASKFLYDAARYALDETKLSLTQQIRDAYWTLAANRALTENSREDLEESRKLYDFTQSQNATGTAPKVDVIRSSIDLANAEQTYLSAQGGERSSLIALNALLGGSTSENIKLADDLTQPDFAPKLPDPLPNLDAMKKRALETRPALLAAKAQTQSAEYGIKQAKANQLPNLTFDYERSTQQNVQTYVMGLSFPLLDFGSERYAIRSADETRKQNQSLEGQVEREVMQQVEQARLDYAQAVQQLTSYRSRILLPSGDLIGMARLGYQQGATGILPVLDAEKTLRDARSGYVNSLLVLFKAEDEALAATGVLPSSFASSASDSSSSAGVGSASPSDVKDKP